MVLPRVKKEVIKDGGCRLPSSFGFKTDEHRDKISCLFPAFIEGITISEKESDFVKFIKNSSFKSEEYLVKISDKIEVYYKDYIGIRNALSLIANMINKDLTLPCGEFYDYPVFPYRGVMFDLARGVRDINILKEDILLCAKAKMNYIHLHFFDFPGSAIKIKSFPKEAYLPGAYSVDEVKALIEYCDMLALEVIPEFDLPAHSGKMIECFPEIACITDNPNQTKWTACAGSEKLFEIYDEIISELAGIFNSRYFHIGGDEIEFADRPELQRLCHWDECKRCRAYMEKNNINSRQELWYDLLIKVYHIVKKNGKTMIMWSDQLDCAREIPIPRDVIMQFWRVAGEGRGPHRDCSMNAQLKAGYKIINSHFPDTYVDLEQYINSDKLKNWSPLESPESDGEYKENITGSELCAWEYGNRLKYSHYDWSLPSAIVLMGDKLWNGDSLPYSEEYSRSLTRTVLGQSTPEGFDIYPCFGDIIPPRTDERIYKDKITIKKEEMDKALSILLSMKGNFRADSYYDAITKGISRSEEFEVNESLE